MSNRSAQDLIDYLDGFYVSGNEVPVDRPWISQATWKLVKEFFAEGLPLDHGVIESELIYRRKLATYGDETRARSPLDELRRRIVWEAAGKDDQHLSQSRPIAAHKEE